MGRARLYDGSSHRGPQDAESRGPRGFQQVKMRPTAVRHQTVRAGPGSNGQGEHQEEPGVYPCALYALWQVET